MPDLVLLAVTYGGYISVIKLIAFLILFFLWLPLLGWVYGDARSVETKEVFWTGLVLGAGAVTALVWFVIPIFVVGLLSYIIAVGATSLAYVKHRNARVLDFDRVLTIEHIKGLFGSEAKKLEALQGFLFVTANNNEVPVPEPRTPDFFGYRAAYEILNDALWRRASSIVFSPTPQDYNVTYYVDGAGLKQPALNRDQAEYFVHFIKQLADLHVKEKRKPQKGKFRTSQKKEHTNWEVVTAGSTVGEQVILKRIAEQDIMRLNEIGLMPTQYEQLAKFRELKQGLFIVSGPKSSGVTTTLYALLRNHDAFLNNINTLETQPSAELPNITQNIFKPTDTGTTTYAKKLEAVARMGPDVIGIAECPDAETAQMACKASLDGKVIYVVLKADSVIQALGKWMKLVGDRRLVSKTLLGVSNQRLFRKLCDECKQAYAPNKELLRKFNLPAEKAKVLYRPGKVVYDKRGKPSACQHCQETGFVGRTGVFEMIMIDDELKKAIRRSKSLPEIGMQFRRAKMLYLQEQTLRKAIAGTTAINEMVRVLSTSKKTGTRRTG
ncbi:MAG: Flp pilus assembly complex ATPase component TadA [Phycisphaerales bacterium]|nr:MAG: Flp pilus assembly complex ATPase component TadA [Phycisphaerales bacterium]